MLRSPFSLRVWLQYIDHKRNGSSAELYFVYERALSELPGSYKLWKQYLDIRREKLKGLNAVRHKALYSTVIALYERALVLLNKV